MRKKTAVIAFSVLALAPTLAACGSSGSSSASGSASGSAKASSSTSARATSSAAAGSAQGAKAKATTGANGCSPVSKKGNCYLPKEECAKTQHGMKGTEADGKKIVCKQTGGRWEWQLA